MQTGYAVGGLDKHVPASEEGFGSDFVQDGLGVHLGRETECDSGREVGLDCTRDDISGRALRGEHQVDTCCAGLGRNSRDARFHSLLVAGHEVSHLVDYHHDALAGVGAMEVIFHGFHVVVERADRTAILGGGIRKHLVTFFHHVNQGSELLDGILHIVDDLDIRENGIGLHFGPFRIDKDQLHFHWVVVHQQVANHGVEKHALARPGLSRHEHVGGLCQVELDGIPENIDTHPDFHGAVLDTVAPYWGHDGTAWDNGAALVRHLDTDKAIAAFETDGLAGDAEAHGDVFQVVSDIAYTDAIADLHEIACDYGALLDADNLGVQVQILEGHIDGISAVGRRFSIVHGGICECIPQARRYRHAPLVDCFIFLTHSRFSFVFLLPIRCVVGCLSSGHLDYTVGHSDALHLSM